MTDSEKTNMTPSAGNPVGTVLCVGLLLMAACLFLPGVEFRERYALSTIPMGLLVLVVASIAGGRWLEEGFGRFILIFAMMLIYSMTASARIVLPALEERFPWLLPWSTIVLLLLIVVWLLGVLPNASLRRRIEGQWQPLLWSVVVVLGCGLAIKLAVNHMAVANEAYQTPDWLEPKFMFHHLVFRCLEYGLLYLIISSVPTGKSSRLLGWGVGALLIVRAALSLVS